MWKARAVSRHDSRRAQRDKKTHHGQGHRSLAIAPRHVLDHHPVLGALHPPGGIEKPSHDAPQRHKEPPALRQPVIARSGPQAREHLAGMPPWGSIRDFDAAGPAVPMAVEADVLENKAGKMLNGVQNGLNLQLHRWSSGLMRSIDSSNDWINRRPVFFYRRQRAILSCGSGDRALQECNPSTGPSVDCSDCIPPGSGKLPDRVFAFWDASASHGQSEKLILPLSAVRPLSPDGLPTNSATDPQIYMTNAGQHDTARSHVTPGATNQTTQSNQSGPGAIPPHVERLRAAFRVDLNSGNTDGQLNRLFGLQRELGFRLRIDGDDGNTGMCNQYLLAHYRRMQRIPIAPPIATDVMLFVYEQWVEAELQSASPGRSPLFDYVYRSCGGLPSEYRGFCAVRGPTPA